MDPDRRRSLLVNLTLIGLAGAYIAAPMIPEGKKVQRNLYPNRESCERDYSPAQCQSDGSGSGGGGGGGGVHVWRGPEYVADRSDPAARSGPGAGRSGQPTPIETSTRGGFGRVGRVLRAVG